MYFDPKLRGTIRPCSTVCAPASASRSSRASAASAKTMLLHCLAAELDVADHVVVRLSCLGSPSAGDIVGAFAAQIGSPGPSEDGWDEDGQPNLADLLASSGIHGTTAVLLLDDADSLTVETLSALLAMSAKRPKIGATVSIVLAGSSDLVGRPGGE